MTSRWRASSTSGSWLPMSCSTSPPAMVLVASASTCITRMSSSSTIIWNAREYRKSPTSTAGDGVGGLGEHLHHAHVVELDHHLERARVQEVADQHRRRVAEGRIRGAAAAAQMRLVDHVVMQ